MISRLTITIGIVAVLIGLAATYGVRTYLAQEEVAPPPPKVVEPETYKIPLAAVDLPSDRVVVGSDTFVKSMTLAQFKAAFPKLELEQVLASVRSVENRRLKQPVKQGQPFLTTDFYLAGTGPSVASKLEPGFRAVRVEVPNTREAGVQAGTYVDVFFRANAQRARAGQVAIPEKTLKLLQHVEVLNAERPAASKTAESISGGVEKKPLLFTLAVPEDKVEMFSVIQGRGELWLVPTPAKDGESPNGSQAAVADTSTLAGLLGIKPMTPPPAPFETEIYQRGRRTVNKFVDDRWVASRTNVLDSGTMSDQQEPSGAVAAPPAPEGIAPPPAQESKEVPSEPPAPELDFE